LDALNAGQDEAGIEHPALDAVVRLPADTASSPAAQRVVEPAVFTVSTPVALLAANPRRVGMAVTSDQSRPGTPSTTT
jgi:hypothetical protein